MDWPSPSDFQYVVLALCATFVVAAVPTPAGLSGAGQHVLATLAFAAILWITGGLPLSVTALLVPVWLTVFGVYPRFESALTGYADPIIFLFLGTFVLARALRKHDIDRRVALALVGVVGVSPRRVVFGLMLTTALLSMAISNTATVAMMVPVTLGLVSQLSGETVAPDGTETHRPSLDPADTVDSEGPLGVDVERSETVGSKNLQVVALLGVAYAGSIGGLGTLIGTPPNAIVVSEIEATLGVRLTFLDWMLIGVPLVVLTLPMAWYLLMTVYPPRVSASPEAARVQIRDLRDSLDPLDTKARRTAAVFFLTAVLWILGGLGFLFEDIVPPWLFTTLFGGGGTSLFATGGHQGVLYFALVGVLAVPALVVLGAIDESDIQHIDWNTLLLFGGGLSLASALVDTEATSWVAELVFEAFFGVPLAVLVFVIVVLTVALSELASNTATVAILTPILIEVGATTGAGYGMEGSAASLLLAVTTGVAASYGFALPVATPPNAIVFGTGELTRGQMLRAGFLLDVVMAVVTTVLLLALFAVGFPFK
ncbi:MAG: SLC13 family permease [Halobacteriota archaeon]